MSIFLNYATHQAEKLRVLYPFQLTPNGWKWVAVCECGTVKIVLGAHLKVLKSCGCWKRQYWQARITTHGQGGNGKARSKVYKTYLQVKERCENPRTQHYPLYGARGIRCEFQSFEEFYATLGDHPGTGYSIDRYPNRSGNYAPGNVRWATLAEQNNNKRTNINITYDGRTQTLAQWAHEKQMSVPRLHWQYYQGWSYERMLS